MSVEDLCVFLYHLTQVLLLFFAVALLALDLQGPSLLQLL